MKTPIILGLALLAPVMASATVVEFEADTPSEFIFSITDLPAASAGFYPSTLGTRNGVSVAPESSMPGFLWFAAIWAAGFDIVQMPLDWEISDGLPDTFVGDAIQSIPGGFRFTYNLPNEGDVVPDGGWTLGLLMTGLLVAGALRR